MYQVLTWIVVLLHGAVIAFIIFTVIQFLRRTLKDQVLPVWQLVIFSLMCAVVVAAPSMGYRCPLTMLENFLREKGTLPTYQGSYGVYYTRVLTGHSLNGSWFLWWKVVIGTLFGIALVLRLKMNIFKRIKVHS